MASSQDDSESHGDLKKIPTSAFARATKLTKLAASMGVSAGLASLGKKPDLILQAKKLAKTLGEMKGGAMKVGQLLSMHADTLLPKEVTEILIPLQGHSQPLDWKILEPVIKRELGDDFAKRLLDFSKRPIAAASIGQVHKACLPNGTWVAVKIQYPGIAESIDSDVSSLSAVLKVFLSWMRGESFDSIISEIRDVLHQEVDYEQEAKNLSFFREKFLDQNVGGLAARVALPEVMLEHSTKKVLVTELMKGMSVQEFADSPESTQVERNFVGETFMQVFYNEIFGLGVVQTDPNFANYKIIKREGENVRLLLLDFGAVRRFSEEWRRAYLSMVEAAYRKDEAQVLKVSHELGFLREGDSEECKALHLELCEMFLEPLRVDGPYDFHTSDLPQRLRAMVPRIIKVFDFRAPPSEIVFLNRKMVGAYFFLAQVRARVDLKPLFEAFI